MARISFLLVLDSDGTCNLNAVGDKSNNQNANLGPLQINGGPTETHALLPGSDAIDMGDPTGCKDHDGIILTTDQRGFVRPISVCDIGAYEFRSHLPSGVGGVTSFSGGPGSSTSSIALLAGGAAALVAITAGAWYTRRRWLGSRL